MDLVLKLDPLDRTSSSDRDLKQRSLLNVFNVGLFSF